VVSTAFLLERESTILAHRYLCRRGARRFLRSGLERDDLEQVAAVGLVKATDRYDARTQTPFEAFAWLMILGELGHHVRDHEHLIRAPRELRALDRLHAKAWERLAIRLEREPNDREIASELDKPFAKVRELRVLRGFSQPLELDDPAVLPDVEDGVEQTRSGSLGAEEMIVLERALGSLPRLERLVVHGMYWRDLSRAELGRRLGVSAKVVARIHRAALTRLRLDYDPELSG
jgi:RNA polymerase sigma-B factor